MFAINTQYAVRRLLPFIFSIFLGCILHGQAFSQIVINEIIQNPAAVSDAVGEWFEVFNPGGSPVDINGWTIRDNDFDSHVIDNSGPLMVPAGGFLVLGINADFAANGGVTVGYQYSDLFLANGADELVLLDTTMAEIDRVEWDGGPSFPDPNGASMSLVGPGLDNNVGANWCEAPTPFGAGDRGTPGAANDCPIGPPLVINEIDYDQPGLDLAEFIEIKNTGNSIESLSGVTLLLVNGATGASYGSFPLPSVSLAPGDYFVVCTNAATVQNCDLDVLSSIQNGSPDAVALIFSGVVFDAVSYEGDTVAPYTEGSGSGLEDSGASGQDFKGIGRFPDGVDTDQNNVDLVNSCITPGRPNTSLSGNCAPGGPALEIFEVQGSGLASPSAGQAVSLADNAVTALGTNGFFIQTPSARTDGDVDTSDGIFVFTGGAPAVSVGDRVDVTGNVIEFFGFTEVTGSPSVSVTGSGAVPDPVSFDPTVPSPDPLAPSCAIELECYEGMLVEIANGSVTGPNQRFGSDPIAEVFVVARPNRAFREPGIEFPGISGYPVWDGNPEVIELDPDKLGLPNQIIPAGSSFSGIGVLGYEFGGYEFWPRELTFTPAPLPVPVRGRDEGEVTVATLNLFRLFDDFDDPPSVNAAGQTRNDFVASAEEYLRRRAKFALYILNVLDAPDVLAVQEAEKIEVLQDLAADINALDGSVSYTAYLIEGNDVGTIDVGFLVRDGILVDRVTQLGLEETFIDPTDGSVDLLNDRPPLMLDLRIRRHDSPGRGGGKKRGHFLEVSVIVVHSRSLGGIDNPSDGARVRQKRYEQAQFLARTVSALENQKPKQKRVIVLGDFNAFEFSDGYVDVLGQIKGDFNPAENVVCQTNTCENLVTKKLTNHVESLDALERYSFIFQGSAQVLDHALTTEKLKQCVAGAAFGRGNADAAVDLINDISTPLRASDHDGLVLFINPQCNGRGDDHDLKVAVP